MGQNVNRGPVPITSIGDIEGNVEFTMQGPEGSNTMSSKQFAISVWF